jgi:DNA-binding transcriptional LysR family regulator
MFNCMRHFVCADCLHINLKNGVMRHLQQLVFVDAVARAGSIRRAAETLAITSTALNRRILAIEEDLGTPIFERLTNGVRLSTAGELFIQHVRQQLGDMERLKSQIADLSGVRRGHVSILCGQALMESFLPEKVNAYRQEHPNVTFSVRVCGRNEVSSQLLDFSADVGMVFEPEMLTGIQVISEVKQTLHALMHRSHPLVAASEIRAASGNTAPSQTPLRLADCAQFPLALPSIRSGVRHTIVQAAARRSLKLNVAVESDNAAFLQRCLVSEPMISFQIPVALSHMTENEELRCVPLHPNDLSPGSLLVLQHGGRTLSVASARFVSRVVESLQPEARAIA